MRPEQFQSDAPGRLEKSILGHWTFIPAPLPPQLEYPASLLTRIVAAERALGELAGVGQFLPNSSLLIRPFLKREAVLSSKIEGTVTRLDQLLLYEAQTDRQPTDPDDVQEVVNYVRALDYGLERMKTLPLCSRLLCEIH